MEFFNIKKKSCFDTLMSTTVPSFGASRFHIRTIVWRDTIVSEFIGYFWKYSIFEQKFSSYFAFIHPIEDNFQYPIRIWVFEFIALYCLVGYLLKVYIVKEKWGQIEHLLGSSRFKNDFDLQARCWNFLTSKGCNRFSSIR